MERHFSLIQIGQKLRSLMEFSGCSAMIFESDSLSYAYKKEPSQQIVEEVIHAGSEMNSTLFLEKRTNLKTVSLPSGKLTFVDPAPSLAESTLEFLGTQMEYDIQFASVIDTVFQASVTISSDLHLKALLHKVMSLSEEILQPEVTAVMLTDWEKNELFWEISRGEKSEFFQERITLPMDQGIGGFVARTGKSVLIDDVQKDIRWDCSYDEKSGFCTHSMICVPMKFRGKVLGVIEVINKKGGAFTSRDLRLLEILAAQAGSAIQNALLFQETLEKQRMEEELAIARDLQMSMLPATCPKIKGLEIAAKSIPAREVGGDFYDFIEMGRNRAGMVVGDVTGKSVSGALVMAASRSVFRFLSEEGLSLGEIMVRANKRIKKDIKSEMFVALLYAVIDGEKKNMRLSNAGQIQPIHFSTITGEAKLVETEGDTFPLGILDDAHYEETGIQLTAGDKIVFYTDGVVEAMNEHEELFGFDRLLQIIQQAGSMTAETLLGQIMSKVNEFAGNASQHDDLTVIAVSVSE